MVATDGGEVGRRALTSDSLTVAAGTLVSRVSGLGRIVVVAAVLGPTFFGNLFEAANFVPNIIFVLLTGPHLVAFVVPHLVRAIDQRSLADASRLTSELSGFVIVVFGAIAVGLAVGSSLVIRVVTLGVDDPQVAADQRRLGMLLVVFVAPQVVLYGLAGVGAAAQNARRRFALAAGAPAIENLGVIVTMLLYASRFGAGRPLAEVAPEEMVFLGVGSTIAVALHAALQIGGAARVGISMWPSFRFGDADFRAIIRDARSVVLTASLQGGRHLAVLMVAGIVPGGVVAFRMAFNFYNLPIALVARPVAAASQPDLTLQFANGDRRQFRAQWYRSLTLMLFLVVPASVAYFVLAPVIASSFAFGEMATDRGIELLTVSIVALSGGIIGASLVSIGSAASYASGDARSPMTAMFAGTVTTGVGLAVGFWLVDGVWVLAVLGLAFTAGDWVGAIRLQRTISDRLAAPLWCVRWTIRGIVGASLVVGAVSGGIVVLASDRFDDRLGSALLLLAASGAGVVCYGYLQWLMRSEELAQLIPRLRRPDQDPSLDHRNEAAGAAGMGVVALATVLLAAAAIAVHPVVAIGLVVAVAVVVATAMHPPLAAYLFLAATPLIVGLPRDGLVPLIRPSEGLLVLLLVGPVAARLIRLAQGEPLTIRWGPLHAPLIAMAVAASFVPLLWMSARGDSPALDDLLFAATLWKFIAVYVLFRSVIDTEEQVRRCIAVILGVHAVVGAIAILQAVGVLGVPELLGSVFSDSIRNHANNRGSSVFDSSHAVGDTMTICLAIVVAIIARRGGRPWSVGLGLFFFVATLASGQVSALLGLAAGMVVAGRLTGQLAGVSRSGFLALGGGALLLQQTISQRLSSVDAAAGVPTSWLSRWENLREHFWPQLFDGTNILFGVRPSARVPAPEAWRDWIWIDSGLTWLLWTGGLPLLAAFVWFLIRGLRTTAPQARVDGGSVGVAAVGAASGLVVVACLMVLDAHLTLRGTADLLFPLLALATVGMPQWRRPSPRLGSGVMVA